MKKVIFTLLALAAAVGAGAQGNSPGAYSEQGRANVPEWRATKHAWELGVGGSVYQFNRMPHFQFTETETANMVDVKLRHVVWAGQIYAARELSNVFALDFTGALGKIENEWLAHAGLGLQWRLGHYFRSPWIDPYLRVGAGYMHKGYDTAYAGEQNGARYQWWNVSNKDGADARSVIPVSAGVGVNMWLNDRFGIGLSGDYLHILKNRVANPVQGTARLLFRFGGPSKRPAPVVTYVDRPVDRIVEVEKIVERIVERPAPPVESTVDLNELLSGIHFDFDKHDVKPEYNDRLDRIRDVLLQNTANRYLLSGFTDSHGSAAYNLGLSQRRVNAIRQALVDRGVPAGMLKTRGHGMRISNLSPGASEYARMGDRKVTIELITNMEYWNQL